MPSEVCEDDESKGNRKRILRVYKNLTLRLTISIGSLSQEVVTKNRRTANSALGQQQEDLRLLLKELCPIFELINNKCKLLSDFCT